MSIHFSRWGLMRSAMNGQTSHNKIPYGDARYIDIRGKPVRPNFTFRNLIIRGTSTRNTYGYVRKLFQKSADPPSIAAVAKLRD